VLCGRSVSLRPGITPTVTLPPIFLIRAARDDLQHAVRKTIVKAIAHIREVGLQTGMFPISFGSWLEIDQRPEAVPAGGFPNPSGATSATPVPSEQHLL
jgi:hypothetical protein